MKYIVPLACCLLVGCTTSPHVVTRHYDAGPFIVQYDASEKIDPVFTGIYKTPKDRADGMIYFNSKPPGGFFDNIPGSSFAIALMPASRFPSDIKDEDHLASRLPEILKGINSGRTYQIAVITDGSRKWTQCKELQEKQAITTHITYYSFIDPEHIICIGWDHPRQASPEHIKRDYASQLLTLNSIKIQKK